MKSTRLWQSAGSPLIQGRSRGARGFWVDWLSGAVVGSAFGYALALAFLLVVGVDTPTAVRAAWLPVGIIALPASAAGVLLARMMGWRRSWRAGAALAAVLAIPGVWGFTYWALGRLDG